MPDFQFEIRPKDAPPATNAAVEGEDALSRHEELPSRPMLLNLGPSHPATHGTVRIVAELDGEIIRNADVEIGYLHRGFEKSGENSTWTQVLPYTDRLNYVSPLLCNVSYVMAVEKLLGITDPERSKYIRVIAGELSRITDHLTCCGAMSLELGGFAPFIFALEARELIWDRISELTGARMTTSYTRVGGVARDIPEGWPDLLRATLSRVAHRREEI